MSGNQASRKFWEPSCAPIRTDVDDRSALRPAPAVTGIRNGMPLGERYEWCRKERERDAEIARKLAQIRAHIAHSTPQNGGSLPR